jgi:RNA polymerase sigma-70 factor (ECF subfamily)
VTVETVFREEWGRSVAILTRVLGDPDLAEDAVQEAFATALIRWPRDGTPLNPGAWIVATARNRAIDRLRRERTLRSKTELLLRLAELELPEEDDVESAIPDERLALMFACCHPALALDAQVALTLRLVAGLETDAIARAFLVPEATLAQRLVRAKRKLRVAGIPVRVPPDHLLPDRLPALLAVLYLVYNEGYGGRDALADEAIRLARIVCDLMPDEPEALALAALMLLHDSRRAARSQGGALVLLDDQDASLWDAAKIAAGRQLVDRAVAFRRPGPYQLQAAIAALQTERPRDAGRIAALYERLAELQPSPVVALNRAVAVAEANGPEAGLALLDGIELEDYVYAHTARAALLDRLDRRAEACEAYRRALDCPVTELERRFIAGRLAALDTAATRAVEWRHARPHPPVRS